MAYETCPARLVRVRFSGLGFERRSRKNSLSRSADSEAFTPRRHVDAVVEHVAVEQSEVAGHCPCLRVVRAVDQSSESSVHRRPGAHRTRLERHVQRAFVESPLSQRRGRRRASRGSRRARTGRWSVPARCGGTRSRRLDGPPPLRPGRRGARGSACFGERQRHRIERSTGRQYPPTWRREWDSNPRKVALHTLSKRADSAALASLPVASGAPGTWGHGG